MRSNIIEQYKQTLVLNKRQRSILVGLLLGDGHVEKTHRWARLKVEHGIVQKSYVDWLYKEFQDWILRKPTTRKRIAWGKERFAYGFTTVSHPEFDAFRALFYQGRRKIIPQQIDELLDPLALSIWFMDDGSMKSKRHKGFFLNTQGFLKADLERLIMGLSNKFKIEPLLRVQRTGWQLYCGGENARRYAELTKEMILPEFRYKTPRW